MKIEVELLKIDQDTGKARTCAVALLCALPHDEAVMAIAEWRAVQMVRAEDEAALREAYQKAEEAVAAKATIPPQETAADAAIAKEVAELNKPWESPSCLPFSSTTLVKAQPAPPQDVGYSAPPAMDLSGNPADVLQQIVESTGAEVAPAELQRLREAYEHAAEPGFTVPDYKIGGWVVTDLSLLGRIRGIKDTPDGRHLELEFDDGEQRPTRKLFSVDRVRPATEKELGEDRAPVTPTERPDGGGKKKRGRPKKVAQELQQPEPNGGAAEAAAAPLTPFGEKMEKYAGMTLKELCKLAEHEAGRPKVWDLFKEYGVGKLDGAEPQRLASLRAAVLELIP